MYGWEKIMKAFVLDSYGSVEALDLTEIDKPAPAPDEVRVRVRATSVQPYDWHHLHGEPLVARLLPGTLGLRRPKLRVLGADIAGEVDAVGADVTGVQPGDEVFAMSTQGGFAEYACVRATALAPKPESLSFAQAAAVPMAANTALLAVRDDGRVQPGQQVLVHGAGGGVGTFAVQLAKAFGAQVTGVCRTRNVDLVRSLGADEVVDHTTADFTRDARRYDLLVDVAGSRSPAACRRALTRKGTHVVVGGPAGRWLQPVGHMIAALAPSRFVSQRVTRTDVFGGTDVRENLLTLATLVDKGEVTPVVDRTYPFEEIPAAIRYQEGGHAQGKVVVEI